MNAQLLKQGTDDGAQTVCCPKTTMCSLSSVQPTYASIQIDICDTYPLSIKYFDERTPSSSLLQAHYSSEAQYDAVMLIFGRPGFNPARAGDIQLELITSYGLLSNEKVHTATLKYFRTEGRSSTQVAQDEGQGIIRQYWQRKNETFHELRRRCALHLQTGALYMWNQGLGSLPQWVALHQVDQVQDEMLDQGKLISDYGKFRREDSVLYSHKVSEGALQAQALRELRES
jgi:hypothetical protein